MGGGATSSTSTGVRPGWSLICSACGGEAPAGEFARGCQRCRSEGRTAALVARYDEVGPLPSPERSAAGIWKFAEFLPRIDPRFQRTIGEADTPLVQVPALAELTGNPRVHLKLEMCNPTAAHKDRFHSVAVGIAAALGARGVCSASTGNHGFSMASYAAAHGLPAVIVGNPRMPPLIQKAIRFVGGLPLLAPPEMTGEILTRLVAEDWYPSTISWPMPEANPYGIEGYKTIGYEVYQALGNRMPDLMFFPAAAGDGVVGVDRAISDLERLGLPNTSSQLVACQPATAAPLVNALSKGMSYVEELPGATSRALSIGDPISGGLALDALRASDGFAVAITDDDIMATGRFLASAGLTVEPSSAASVAGAIQIMRERPELREREMVCVITSSGLKWLDDYAEEPLPGGTPVSSVGAARREVESFVTAMTK